MLGGRLPLVLVDEIVHSHHWLLSVWLSVLLILALMLMLLLIHVLLYTCKSCIMLLWTDLIEWSRFMFGIFKWFPPLRGIAVNNFDCLLDVKLGLNHCGVVAIHKISTLHLIHALSCTKLLTRKILWIVHLLLRFLMLRHVYPKSNKLSFHKHKPAIKESVINKWSIKFEIMNQHL